MNRLIKYRKSDEPITVGHDFIKIDYSLSTPLPPPICINSRNTSHLNSNLVSPHLIPHLTALAPSSAQARSSQINFHADLPTTQIDSFSTALYNAIMHTFNQLAPPMTFTTSPCRKPWVTADIRRLIAQLRRLNHIAYRSPSSQSTAAYHKHRNEICSHFSTTKNHFITTRIDRASSVTDKWCELRKLSLNSQKSNSPFKYFKTFLTLSMPWFVLLPHH